MCDMTHSYVWHASFICVTWLICVCDMTHSNVWRDSSIRVAWLIYMCDMTHSHICGGVQHDATHCNALPTLGHTDAIGTKRHQKTQMTHSTASCNGQRTYSCVWRDSSIFCSVTHSYVWHDSIVFVTRLIRTHAGGRHSRMLLMKGQMTLSFEWLIHMCDMTHSYVWHDSFICVT